MFFFQEASANCLHRTARIGFWLAAFSMVALVVFISLSVVARYCYDVDLSIRLSGRGAYNNNRIALLLVLFFSSLAWIQLEGGFPRMWLDRGFAAEVSSAKRLFGSIMTTAMALMLSFLFWFILRAPWIPFATGSIPSMGWAPWAGCLIALMACLLLGLVAARQACHTFAHYGPGHPRAVLVSSLTFSLILLLLPVIFDYRLASLLPPLFLCAFLLGGILLSIAWGMSVPFAILFFCHIGLYMRMGGWAETRSGEPVAMLTFYGVEQLTSSALAIFLLIFAGQLVLQSGYMRDIYVMVTTWLGRLPGGFALSTLVASTSFGSYNGYTPGQSDSHHRAILDDMHNRGYSPALTLFSITLGAGLGRLLFPGIILPLTAFMLHTSTYLTYAVGSWTAGTLLGLLSIFLFLMALFFPTLTPRNEKYSWWAKLRSLFPPLTMSLLAIMLPWNMVILDLVTVTEASAVACVLVFIHITLYGRMNRVMLIATLEKSVRLSSAVALACIGVHMLEGLLNIFGVPHLVQNMMGTLALSPFSVLLVLAGIFLLLGRFMDTIFMLLLGIPFMAPVFPLLEAKPPLMVCIVSALALAGRSPALAQNLRELIQEQKETCPAGSKSLSVPVPSWPIAAIALIMAVTVSWLLIQNDQLISYFYLLFI